LGALTSLRNIKYIRMHHFEKKKSIVFSPKGPHENVRGPGEKVSPGPAVALDGPASYYASGKVKLYV